MYVHEGLFDPQKYSFPHSPLTLESHGVVFLPFTVSSRSSQGSWASMSSLPQNARGLGHEVMTNQAKDIFKAGLQ